MRVFSFGRRWKWTELIRSLISVFRRMMGFQFPPPMGSTIFQPPPPRVGWTPKGLQLPLGCLGCPFFWPCPTHGPCRTFGHPFHGVGHAALLDKRICKLFAFTRTHIHTYPCICVYTHMRVYACTHICVYKRVHTYACTHICVFFFVHTYACICVYTHMRVHTYASICV